MHNLSKSIGSSFLSIISNTVVIVPYLLFIQLSDGVHLATILPFVLFYTFRMTGLFLIRGINNNAKTFNILYLSIIFGIIGSAFAILGFWYTYSYIVAGICLGLSAAWLPMANTTVGLHFKANQLKVKNNVGFSLLLMILLLIVFLFGGSFKLLLSFTIYGLYYVGALYSLKNYPDYNYEETTDDKKYSFKYLTFFILFFVFMIFLRSGRLLNNTYLITFSIFLFISFFIIYEIINIKKRDDRIVSSHLNNLSLINGIIGNFLFLFSSLYVSAIYGKENIAMILYLPYVLGMTVAPILGPKILTKTPNNKIKTTLEIILLGCLIMFFPVGTPIALFCISFGKSLLSSELNKEYYGFTDLPQDKRILVKYTTQSEGSILHQFSLMFIIYLIITLERDPISLLLSLTGSENLTQSSIDMMMLVKYISLTIIMLILGAFLLSNKKKKNNI